MQVGGTHATSIFAKVPDDENGDDNFGERQKSKGCSGVVRKGGMFQGCGHDDPAATQSGLPSLSVQRDKVNTRVDALLEKVQRELNGPEVVDPTNHVFRRPLTADVLASEVRGDEYAEAFRVFERLDVDASGKISLVELQRSFMHCEQRSIIVEFRDDECDVGIVWGVNERGELVVNDCEEGSPAGEHDRIFKGLRLLKFNSTDARTLNVKRVEALVESAIDDEEIRLEFCDPLFTVTEMCKFIDIELGEETYSIELPVWVYESRKDFLVMLRKRASEVPELEWFTFDFPEHLGGKKLMITSGPKSKPHKKGPREGEVDVDGPPFRLAFKTGPNKHHGAHVLLGFAKEDTYAANCIVGDNTEYDLGLNLTRDQIEIFSQEIVAEYDGNENAEIDFDEFFRFYQKYLANAERMGELMKRAGARFFDHDAERRRLRKLERLRRKAERVRTKMLKHRKKAKIIMKKQTEDRKGRCFVDAHGLVRRRHDYRSKDVAASEPIAWKQQEQEQLTEAQRLTVLRRQSMLVFAKKRQEQVLKTLEARTRNKDIERRQRKKKKERLAALIAAQEEQKKMNEKTRLWAEQRRARELDMIGVTSEKDGTPKQDTLHVTCIGYYMRKIGFDWDPYVISPAFFGSQWVHESKMTHDGGSMHGATNLAIRMLEPKRTKARRGKHAWQHCPSVPTVHGEIRQRHKHVGERYDRSELVHPAFFGYVVNAQSQNFAVVSPIFAGYSLLKKPTKKEENTKRENVIGDPVKDAEENGCPICLIRKPGCPLCWDFPRDSQPHDFAYEGPLGRKEKTTPRAEFHTDLTTMRALTLYRQINHTSIQLFIKTVPCGPLISIVVEKNMPVHYLYSQFRCNSNKGNSDLSCLFMPTVCGLFSLDNEVVPETDAYLGIFTGDLPLSRYNIATQRSQVALLHFEMSSDQVIQRNTKHYLMQNLRLQDKPSSAIFYELDKLPREIPGQDPVQTALVGVLESQMEMHAAAQREDREMREAEQQESIRLCVENAKRKSVHIRRASRILSPLERVYITKAQRRERRVRTTNETFIAWDARGHKKENDTPATSAQPLAAEKEGSRRRSRRETGFGMFLMGAVGNKRKSFEKPPPTASRRKSSFLPKMGLFSSSSRSLAMPSLAEEGDEQASKQMPRRIGFWTSPMLPSRSANLGSPGAPKRSPDGGLGSFLMGLAKEGAANGDAATTKDPKKRGNMFSTTSKPSFPGSPAAEAQSTDSIKAFPGARERRPSIVRHRITLGSYA